MTNIEQLKILHKIQTTLLGIKQALDVHETQAKGETMVDPKVSALITEFDQATDKIAARIQRIIENGSLNAESQAALQSEVDKLNALGQDPNNPVPADQGTGSTGTTGTGSTDTGNPPTPTV